MTPHRLTLRLLGEMELARDGRGLTLPASKKTRALLAYLAATGKTHRRDRLCALFWDVPDDPRGALRWSLSKLRALVDEPERPRIVAEREHVGLDAADIDIDLVAARRTLDDPAAGVAALATLADRFRGDFLEGLDLANCPEFAAWCAAEREEARALHRRVLAALVSRLEAQPAEALPHARRLAAVDPDNVEAHATLLRLLAAAGRLREAEDQFAASQKILAEASANSAAALAEAWRRIGRAEPPRTALAEEIARQIGSPADGERPTVAVLPFESVGGEGGDDYFGRGVSDDIAAELARFADLTVIAPASAGRAKETAAQMPEMAKRLRANYLLDGLVRRADRRMRVTVQLVDGGSGAQLWGDRFDRSVDDVFAVQDEITRTVAASLSLRLRDAGVRRTLKKRTRDMSAYDLLLRARRYTSVLTPEAHARARDCLEEAVRRDPDYADAHAALVYVYASEYSHGHNPRPHSLDRAVAAGQRAVELDPRNPRAHAALALTHFFRRDFPIFEAEAEVALSLNPNDPEMAGMLGAYFVYSGHYDRGLALLEESMRLNPLHPTWYHYSFVIRHVLRGEIEAALARLERVDIKEFHWTLVLRAALSALHGDAAAAAAAWREFRARYPAFDVADYLKRWIASEEYIVRILTGLAAAEAAAADQSPAAAAALPTAPG